MNDTMPDEIEKELASYGIAVGRSARTEMPDPELMEMAQAARASLVSAILDYARTERERGREEAAREMDDAAAAMNPEDPSENLCAGAYLWAADRIRALSSAPSRSERTEDARCAARCTIYGEDADDPRASWICKAPLEDGRCPIHGLATTEEKQQAAFPAPAPQTTPAHEGEPTIRLHTGVTVTPDELAAMWQGRPSPQTTPASAAPGKEDESHE